MGYCPTVEPLKFLGNLGGNVNGLTEPNNRVVVGFVQLTLDSDGLITKDCEMKELAIVYGRFFLFYGKPENFSEMPCFLRHIDARKIGR